MYHFSFHSRTGTPSHRTIMHSHLPPAVTRQASGPCLRASNRACLPGRAGVHHAADVAGEVAAACRAEAAGQHAAADRAARAGCPLPLRAWRCGTPWLATRPANQQWRVVLCTEHQAPLIGQCVPDTFFPLRAERCSVSRPVGLLPAGVLSSLQNHFSRAVCELGAWSLAVLGSGHLTACSLTVGAAHSSCSN